MATENIKWADHCSALIIHSRKLISALYVVKSKLERENDGTTISSPEINVSFRGNLLKPEPQERPVPAPIALFIDPGINKIRKQITKAFPEWKDELGKTLTIISTQTEEILAEFKPYYDLFLACAEYAETGISVLLSIKFMDISFERFPVLASLFFELLVGFIKTILIYSQISKLKKIVLFAYQKAYIQTHGSSPPDWDKVINFMVRIDKEGMKPVYERLDPINKRLANLMSQLETKLTERTMLNATELLKNGIYVAAPSLQGNNDTNYSIMSSQKLFDSYMIGYLVLSNTNAIASQFINSLLQWGYVLNLCRDHNYFLYPELELIMKENPKIPIVKTSKQDVPVATQQILSYHEGRRHMIIDEIHRFRNLLDSHMNFPSFFRVVEVLQIAREEILWYFHHYDKDLAGNLRFKKKDVKVLDSRMGELIWAFKMCWLDIDRNKQDIIKNLGKELLADLQNSTSIIRESLSESSSISANEKELLKQYEELAVSSLLEMKLHDLRTNCARILSASSFQTSPDIAIGPIMAVLERIWNESQWIDKFDEMLTERSSLKELFCFQQDLHDHAKESMERCKLESVKFLVAFGMVSHDFIDIVSSSWAFEHEYVLNDSICYVQDIYSVLGQYAAIIAHDIALATVDYQTAKREVNTVDTKKKGAKKYKKVIAGLESNLQDADPKIALLDEDTQKFRKILELYNVGGTSILHYEFVAFEYFLEFFGEKFRNFINRKVLLEDIILTKENSGVGGVDVMSFDIKRPSAFLSEVHSYLHSVLYLSNITGTNMVEFLVSVWDSQVNETKAKEQWQEPVFTVSKKPKRDNGKSSAPAKPPMMLITIMKWYCEFLGSKAVSGTTAYSEVLNSFCNVDNSSINASFYTDEIELQALVELIGIQGAHFLDEQLLKMFMSSTVAIADISALHASLLANINFKATPAQLKETIKKIPAILEFIDHAKTLAIVAQFRDLLSKAVSNNFRLRFPQILETVKNISSETKLDKQDSVQTLCNQLGIRDQNDQMLQSAMATISSDSKYRTAIASVPIMYAIAMNGLGSDISTTPDGVYQVPKNHANLILKGFEQLILGFYGSLKDYGNEISDAYEKFWTAAATFFVIDNSDLNISKEGRRAISPYLHSFLHQSKVLTPDQVDTLFPFALLKVYLPTVQLVTSPGAKNLAAAREDDMAI